MLACLLFLLRDLYVLQVPGCEGELVNVDLEDPLKALGPISLVRLEDALDAVIQARIRVDENVNPEFLFRVLSKDIKEFLWE